MAKCDTILGLTANQEAFKKLQSQPTLRTRCLVVGVYKNHGKDNRRYTGPAYIGSYSRWGKVKHGLSTQCLYRVVVKVKG